MNKKTNKKSKNLKNVSLLSFGEVAQFFIFSLLIIGLILVFVCHAVYASNKEALSFLEKTSQYYQSLDSFTVDFEQVMEVPATTSERSQGSAAVKKNQFRILYHDQLLINNGKTVWTYLKDENEVTIQHASHENEEFNPAKLYNLHRQGWIPASFKPVIKNKVNYKKIEFTPRKLPPKGEEGDNDLMKMELMIHSTSRQIVQWKTLERNQTTCTYTFKNFTPDAHLKDSYFTFESTQFPGVEVVDLR